MASVRRGEQCLQQLELLLAAGPESVLALEATAPRFRAALTSPGLELVWWRFLERRFAIKVASVPRAIAASAASGLAPRELFRSAAECQVRPISPWFVQTEEQLRCVASSLKSASHGLRQLRAGPPVERVDALLLEDEDEEEEEARPVEPQVYSETVCFSAPELRGILDLWQARDEAGLSQLPGDELVSDSVDPDAEELGVPPRIALSISFAHTSCENVDEDGIVEFDPLSVPGTGRLLALNLAAPDDDHCVVYFPEPGFFVAGRWAWMSEDFKIDPEGALQVPRRLFQTRGLPEGQFLEFLEAAATGRELRVLVISSGVRGSDRDVAPEGSDPLHAAETLFGYDMEMPRPWPDLGAL